MCIGGSFAVAALENGQWEPSTSIEWGFSPSLPIHSLREHDLSLDYCKSTGTTVDG